MGLPQPPNYPLFLCLFRQDCISLLITNYFYGYPYGIAQPPSCQLSLWLFLRDCSKLPVTNYCYGYPYRIALTSHSSVGPSLSVTICSYAYSCRIAPASYLPKIPMAIPTGLPGLLVASTIYSYGYPYGFAPAS